MNNKNPILYNRKEECCGCTACYAICPREAIVMREDAEGFFYPSISLELCIRCNMCLAVCPIKKAKEERDENVRNIEEIEMDTKMYNKQ